MKITLVAGARPNFMKIAPIIDAIHSQENKSIEYRLVHTGQHFDKNMSENFFKELHIPEPHVNLESGGGTQAQQTGNIMIRFEKDLLDNPADIVLVVGDVTSTLACSIVAKKLCTDVAHVEGGIRSGDLNMPEEINRIVTDSISDLFFTTSEVANNNLRNAGVSEEKIHFVGNTMIDTLLKNIEHFKKPPQWDIFSLEPQKFFVLTLHRPSNVDDPNQLQTIIKTIVESSKGLPILFPVHPRTAKNMHQFNIKAPNLHLIEPMSYLQFNYLVKYAKGVITDSGGITEETTVMKVPCITLRDSTERPETVTLGTNELAGTNANTLPLYFNKIFDGSWKKGTIPPMWDGKAAERIISILSKKYS
jgi:UDP-N-acetylglucosamine 2-epimerase (non-hydrolysing)